MLGWNGPNYWGNLASTPDQKRQLLGGTFGVYNSFVIPEIYEIRNWDNTIIIDRLPYLEPDRPNIVARVVLGDTVYRLQSVKSKGDKYIVSIGELDQEFFDQIAANVPLRIDIPTFRPAPFYRPGVGVSGDYSFSCGANGTTLTLYPGYDTEKKFPVKFPTLFASSTYYFDQPVYASLSSTLTPDVSPVYDPALELWALQIPETYGDIVYLAWAGSACDEINNVFLQVLIVQWSDPSDWGSISTLDNFRGTWSNKGGDLPFNFVFDALSIHGFDEASSVFLPNLETSLNYNDIVNFIYYQKTTVSESAPGAAKLGDLWWNDVTGALAVWLPDENNCSAWVEIDYRQEPRQSPAAQVVYPDVSTFQAQSGFLPVGTVVRIEDITGLAIADDVIGVQGTLTSPGSLILHRDSSAPYWTPDEFGYLTVPDFENDAALLPFKVPVTVYNADGLGPTGATFNVRNLPIAVSGDYDVLLMKYYDNRTWEIYPDSILKYIAFSSLFGSPLQGEMWWDFAHTDPNTRAADIYYSSPSPVTALSILDPGVNLPDGTYAGVPLVTLSGTGGLATADITVAGGVVTVVNIPSLTGSGDIYQIGDILAPDAATYPQLIGCTFEVTSTLSEAWIGVNTHPQSGPPAPLLNLGVVLFYCNGSLLSDGVDYVTDDFIFRYTSNPSSGKYEFFYNTLTLAGKAQLPKITISDSITTTYRADVTDLVFSGITYYMSPNVYNAETPLRLWKAQALQVAETAEHLTEDNYINPLLADLNNGPGPENWEKYFVRLPLEYGRNEAVWQKVALVCQDFGYWGSSIEPEKMRCPPEDDLPAIYEELFLYGDPPPDYTYVYCEPFLYSNIAYFSVSEGGEYLNGAVFPASDVEFDEFNEAELITYDPLHTRQADVTSPVKQGYGDWLGVYINVNPCVGATGHLITDLVNRAVEPVTPPVWDASIYKFAPTCENEPATYNVDANHYRIGYAYFVADASAAEDAFFDISQEAAWRYPVTQPRTLYLTPR
jgi:hypothetical protein